MSLMDAKQERRRHFGDALDQALGDYGRAWLGEEVARAEGRDTPISQSAVSQWIGGSTEPEPSRVFVIESVLRLPAGNLSRHLGYLPVDAVPATNVREAIESDPRLPAEYRPTVLRIYDALATIPATDPSPSGSKSARTARTRPSA